MIPRSYVIIRVANTKAQTASIGNVIEFGGQDHASPVWNEVFCLSAETFASCTLKVYTATQNHITDAVFHHQIGRCVFALDSLPFCDECLNEDCSDAERNAVRVELRANQPITSQDREKLLQKDNPKKLPALLDCYLAIPKNSPKDIMKIRSKRQGAPRLTVLAALVPAMDVCGGLDEGGEESAEDPKISPIELPKPFEWLLIDEEFPCSVTKLKNLLFGDASLFLLKFYETQKYKEVFVGDWCAQSGSSAQDCRTVTYMMPSTSFMKSLKATELQKYEVQAPGGCVVEIQSLTPNAPMASTFEVHVQLCLNKLTPKRALLRASAETRFVKSTLLKGQIEKTVKKGLEETYTNLAKTLRGLFGGPRKKKKITEAPTFWLFRNVTISISQLLGGLVVVVLLAVLNLYSFYFIFFKENNAVLQ